MQHKNAPAHAPADDKDVHAAGYSGITAIELRAQPANSFDFNVLNVGIFVGLRPAIQKPLETVEELVHAVYKASNNYSPQKIENNFINLQKCKESSVRVYGGKDWKLQHMKKAVQTTEEIQITKIICDKEVLNLKLNIVRENADQS